MNRTLLLTYLFIFRKVCHNNALILSISMIDGTRTMVEYFTYLKTSDSQKLGHDLHWRKKAGHNERQTRQR